MHFKIFKLETEKRTIIAKKGIEEEGVRCVELASFRTKELRDFTYERLKAFMEVSPEYKDRKFI